MDSFFHKLTCVTYVLMSSVGLSSSDETVSSDISVGVILPHPRIPGSVHDVLSRLAPAGCVMSSVVVCLIGVRCVRMRVRGPLFIS